MIIGSMKVTKYFRNTNSPNSIELQGDSEAVIYCFRHGDAVCERSRLKDKRDTMMNLKYSELTMPRRYQRRARVQGIFIGFAVAVILGFAVMAFANEPSDCPTSVEDIVLDIHGFEFDPELMPAPSKPVLLTTDMIER